MIKRLTIVLFSIFFLLACKKENQTITPSDTSEGSITLLYDEFEGKQLVVTGSKKSNFMVAFERTLEDGTILNFEVKQRDLPSIMTDNEGNEWDIEGKAISGPRQGEQLKTVNSYIGFWFALATMFPIVEIYNSTDEALGYSPNAPATDWTIPTDNVFTVLAQDGIPAVDNPVFETYRERDFIEAGSYFINDDDLVIIVTINGITKVYPHLILNWHEIVNDHIGDFHYSLSFCPITGTAVMWDRNINDNITSFGVSGLLYNGNVMPYDRASNSIWSQMKQNCVTGQKIGQEMEIYQVLETRWSTCKLLRSEPLVMTTETGFGKDYTTNPYENYITDNSWLSYPVEFEDERIPNKERVLGIEINGKAKVYRFNEFGE